MTQYKKMHLHTFEQGTQLLNHNNRGHINDEQQQQNERIRMMILQQSYRSGRQGNNDVLKSICFVSIFAIIAVAVLYYVISQSTTTSQTLKTNNDNDKQNTLLRNVQIMNTKLSSNAIHQIEDMSQQEEEKVPVVSQQKQNVISNTKQAEQQDTFAIEIQQKPQPSSPSQIPKQQQQSLQQQHTNNNQFTPQQPNPWMQQQRDSLVKDKYFFKVPIKKLLQLSSPDKFFGKSLTKQMSGMTFNQLEFSLNLMYVVHNVNSKGQIIVQMAPYDNNRQQKQQWIKKLLQAQKKIYQQKYQISQYMDEQLSFCIVTPSYNNVQSKLYLRNLDSIFMQQYQNYHVVYIDDASPDKTGEFVQRYVRERNIDKEKITIVVNEKNVFALENIYNAVHNYCQQGEIVMLVDGDDALVGRQVLGLYNAIYQRTQSAFVYSNYLHVMYNEKAIIGASSRPIPPQLLKRHGGVRNQRAFFTSHLLSFYVDLFRKIKKQDLTYENGTFYKYAYDVAMCTPMLEMVSDRVFYLPEITYQYRYDTGQNDPGSGQMQVTSLVFEKPVYQPLKQLPFVDDRENYLKQVGKQQ